MRHIRKLSGIAVLAGASAAAIAASAFAAEYSMTVNRDRLINAQNEPQNWLMMNGDYGSMRYSKLTQFNRDNVKNLRMVWALALGGMQDVGQNGPENEVNPLIDNGFMYTTDGWGTVYKIDARNPNKGEFVWISDSGVRHEGNVPRTRGIALWDDLVIANLPDGRVIAINRDSGEIVWDKQVAKANEFGSKEKFLTAPITAEGKVLVANGAGDAQTRGWLAALDVKTGNELWRFYTIPAKGEPGSETWSDPDVLPRGGGATWQTGSSDPELNLLYWGVGNPNPDYFGEDRKGDNLYTASLIALDADTGKLRWHFQFTPHDLHDWDSNHVPVLADLTINGRARKVVMVANRNSFFYTIDRETGEFLVGKPFTGTQWARELTKEGKPIVLTNGVATSANPTCVPDYRGGTNFNPPSYDPSAQLFFVMARETCAIYSPRKEEPIAGRSFMSGGMEKLPDPDYSALRAIDPKTGAIKWEHKFTQSSLAGVMSTASGLVFAGDQDGYFNAFETRSGKLLWRYRTGSPIHGAAATTYMLDGRQFVLIPSGMTITAFALPEGR
jgi:alcohol dehydrogenase (cytochrome c)